jgi:hypothetical protein
MELVKTFARELGTVCRSITQLNESPWFTGTGT